MKTSNEIEELNAYALPIWQNLPVKVKFDHTEVVLDVVILYPDASMKKLKREIKKRMYAEMRKDMQFGKDIDYNKEMTARQNRHTQIRRENDEAYRLKNNKDKNDSAKRIRRKKGKAHKKILAAKRFARRVYNKIRRNLMGIKCMLPKGKCLRKSEKTQYKVGNTCPLAHKYCLKNGTCFPIQPNEDKTQ